MGNTNKTYRIVRNTSKLKGIFLPQMWTTAVGAREEKAIILLEVNWENPSRALKKMIDSIILAVPGQYTLTTSHTYHCLPRPDK